MARKRRLDQLGYAKLRIYPQLFPGFAPSNSGQPASEIGALYVLNPYQIVEQSSRFVSLPKHIQASPTLVRNTTRGLWRRHLALPFRSSLIAPKLRRTKCISTVLVAPSYLVLVRLPAATGGAQSAHARARCAQRNV
jgi:hypothetical protein